MQCGGPLPASERIVSLRAPWPLNICHRENRESENGFGICPGIRRVHGIGFRSAGDWHNRMARRRKDRVRLTSRATAHREKLYKAFIEKASRLYADALVNDKFEISKLADLYALIGRMKISSSDDVIEAAKRLVA